MIRLLSLPMLVTSGTSFIIGMFFLLLYRRLRARHPEAVKHYFLFAILAFVSGAFLAAFSVLLNSGDDLDRLDLANRATIIFAMFYTAFFEYRPPLGLKWWYGVNGAFVLVCLVPNRYFLAKAFFKTSTYYTGLVFGPLFQLWGAWVLAISAYSFLVLLLVYRREVRSSDSHRKGPVLALMIVTAIWLAGGIGDDLTGVQLADLPPLAWIGSSLIIACIAWILILQIDELYEDRQRLHNTLIHDHLTQVFSRGFFDVRLAEALGSLRRRTLPELHLCLFDVDDFKRINDSVGHPAGDQVLKVIGATCKASLRLGDCVARLGGDEFVILIGGLQQPEGAAPIIERIRTAIGACRFEGQGKSFSVSCSFGVVRCGPESAQAPDLEKHLLAAADQALYASKRQGKNAVTSTTLAPPDAAPRTASEEP